MPIPLICIHFFTIYFRCQGRGATRRAAGRFGPHCFECCHRQQLAAGSRNTVVGLQVFGSEAEQEAAMRLGLRRLLQLRLPSPAKAMASSDTAKYSQGLEPPKTVAVWARPQGASQYMATLTLPHTRPVIHRR